MSNNLKHINYYDLLPYPSSILYRMTNCSRYFHSLDSDTQSSIMEILSDRYYEYLWG